MSLLARYLISSYLKCLILSIVSFIAILIVSRLQEIAQFASLGGTLIGIPLFAFYQIPYLLPIALPLSCLLSAFLLFHRLSITQELTTLRASGLSLKAIVSPLLIVALILGATNFYIASELSSHCHRSARKMVNEVTLQNPLLLLQNAKIARLKGAFVQMASSRKGEKISNLVIAAPSPKGDRLVLVLARRVAIKKGELIGRQASFVMTTPSSPTTFDSLFIENQGELRGGATEFASLLRPQGWKVANDHLKLSHLFARIKHLKGQERSAKNKRTITKSYSDISRRISLGFSPFTFTLIAIAAGMRLGRVHSKKGLALTLALAALSLVSFFVAREFDHRFWLSTALFFLPHFILCMVSVYLLRRIARGMEWS